MAKKIEKIAIVTYNRIGDGQYDNGILRRNGKEIYIAQNGHKSKWAADGGTSSEKEETRQMAARSVAHQVDLADMDSVFLYVGSNGGEEAIRQTGNLPAEKVTYIMCCCNYGKKKGMIRDIGNSDAEIMSCECGGRETLEKVLCGLIAG